MKCGLSATGTKCEYKIDHVLPLTEAVKAYEIPGTGTDK